MCLVNSADQINALEYLRLHKPHISRMRAYYLIIPESAGDTVISNQSVHVIHQTVTVCFRYLISRELI